MIPTDDQIEQWFKDLRIACTPTVEADVIDIARRMRSGSTAVDGWKRSHGAIGSRGGGGMVVPDEENGGNDTVTASAVEIYALADDQMSDPTYGQMVLIMDMLGQAATSGRGVVNTRDRIRKIQTPDKAPGHTSTPCRSVGCDGPAVARGWCDPCRKWIARNPSSDSLDPLTVPADVIAERTKRRAKAS